MEKPQANRSNYEQDRADAASAQFVSKQEDGLYHNSSAKTSVFRGLEQVKAGKNAKSPPDLKADTRLVKQLED
jgi:hypothetical protein